eukprot:TRINITY_DN2351_c0_g1_i1.p1 TRINITY_DN2351_c0_g1~~TRINITY_DN2351_c0_g1_i1.p1  ORF type:complete len:553 (-),score=129.69 TRINITY_DN2351_c0_g1_i1:134-1669(-)
MATTGEEGKALLEGQGFTLDADAPIYPIGAERETRSTKRSREVVGDILKSGSKKGKEMTEEELEKYKASLEMVFRIFKHGSNDDLSEADLSAAIKSMGKRATKEKIRAIFAAANKDNTGSITKDEFVNYMVNKQKLKAKEKQPEKKAKKPKVESPSSARQTRSKTSPVKSPAKAASSPVKSPSKKKKAAKQDEPEAAEKDSKQEVQADAAQPDAAPAAAEDAAPARPAMQKGLSIADFFTPHAGLQDQIVANQLDQHNNPLGRGFDLGHEKAFGLFNILLYNFRNKDTQSANRGDPATLWNETKKALDDKGFVVVEATTEKEFLDEIHNFDEVWFISSGRRPEDPERFKAEMRKFHESGRGICIWVDNKPFFGEANVVLQDLLGITMQGDTPANKILKVGNGSKSGEFSRHLITTGIVNLHEGRTICFPNKVTDKMKVLATSTDGHPCMFYTDPSPKSGPIAVDCGFTKLYNEFWSATAGTERYVRNLAVWLLALDYRMRVGTFWKGKIDE